MDSESIRYLFDSISNQLQTMRGELKEDISGVRYDLNSFIKKQETKNMAQILEMDRRKRFENRLMGAFALLIIIIQVASAIVPSLVK